MEELPNTATLPSSEKPDPPLSKNQLKKRLRDEKWEATREFRKAKRKEKNKEKKQLKRAAARAQYEQNHTAPLVASEEGQKSFPAIDAKAKNVRRDQLPISIILDCGFESYMFEKELKSLGSQITRCYSQIQKSTYRPHLLISSFSGHLKERFEGLLEGHFKSWKNVQFLEEDILPAAQQANEWMNGNKRFKMTGAFAKFATEGKDDAELRSNGEVVYLTSESPETLTELRPYSTYIIGGLVDHNRHKGICYRKAQEMGIKTAKLPIGDYMSMNSRYVLATNHVVEIINRWLDCSDWGDAFSMVMPKRKGGVLKTAKEGQKDSASGEEHKSDQPALKEESEIVSSDESDEDGGAKIDHSGGEKANVASSSVPQEERVEQAN